MMGYGNYGYGGNSFMGGGWIAGLMMLLFGALVVAGVVVLIVWLARSSSGHGHLAASAVLPVGSAAPAGHHEAVAIAKRRLASGEIDKDQYDAIMKALSS